MPTLPGIYITTLPPFTLVLWPALEDAQLRGPGPVIRHDPTLDVLRHPVKVGLDGSAGRSKTSRDLRKR